MDNLVNHFLIAMPGMGDPNFGETVTLICEHSEGGALGIVINRPIGMTLGEVLDQLDLQSEDSTLCDMPVMQGGPVQQDRGFVLHSRGGDWDSTLAISETLQITTSQDILAALAEGRGPQQVLVALGYAGWGAGQLEQEMAANAWLSVTADPALVFETPLEERWQRAAGLLGISLEQLSSYAGHA
ncbi:MAG: YqgE/AlgH family protein [Gammaproteobacteria bacterium]|nr:YqgE/AlgH family protein [Gammaproteobacteria bacterium]TVQ50165.1 MAG: YqgE/AlgH family protein [Gammaproteobacteria bacterium]